MLAVDSVRRAEIHGDAVLHHAVLIENPIENAEGPSAADHKIFRNDFKPVHHRFARQDMVVVRRAQPDADAVVRESIETIGGDRVFPKIFWKEGAGRATRPLLRRHSVTASST